MTHHKQKILLIDRFSVVRRYLGRLLENEGYEVVGVKNIHQFLSVCMASHFSLVIFDDSHASELMEHCQTIPTILLVRGEVLDNEFDGGIVLLPSNPLDIAQISHIFLKKVRESLVNTPKYTDSLSSVLDKKIFLNKRKKKMGFVLIGASTGGPRLIEKICRALPANYPHALCVVQHMPTEFTENFAKRLDAIAHISVVQAYDGLVLQKAQMVIAKGGEHLVFQKKSDHYCITFGAKNEQCFFTPSVDTMFFSAREILPLERVLAIELTGIGDDGADGIVALKKGGAYTLAQSEKSAVVYGMPKEAILRGGACKVLDFDAIVEEIIGF